MAIYVAVMWLDYPSAMQEIAGSNSRRVTYFFRFLISFSFRYPSEIAYKK